MARWQVKTLVMAAPVMAAAVAVAGCGGVSSASAGGSGTTASSSGAATGTVSAGGAAATGGTSVAGMQEVKLQMNDDYFSPAVLTGTPGQKVMLDLVNAGGVPHNFTLASQKIDQDVKPGDTAKVQVTFPSSGLISFHCEYHVSRGMKGALRTT